MSKLLTALLVLLSFALISCTDDSHTQDKQPDNSKLQLKPVLSYPETARVDQVDSYYDSKITDPYRWLEDIQSEQTRDWVIRQNQLTADYLSLIPYRESIHQKLSKLSQFKRRSLPQQFGEYLYYKQRDSGTTDDQYFRSKNQTDELFLNNKQLAKLGAGSLINTVLSGTGKYIALITSEETSDWQSVVILDTESRKQVGQTLNNITLSDLTWHGDEGLYYSSYALPINERSSTNLDRHVLYYHRINIQQNEDAVIFGASRGQGYRYISADVSQDKRFLVIQASNSTSGNKVYIQDLFDADSKIKVILNDAYSDTYLLTSNAQYVYLVTNRGAPNRKLIRMPVSNFGETGWEDVIPESDHQLSVSVAGDYFFAKYQINGLSEIHQYDYSGKRIRTISLPDTGSVSNIQGRAGETDAYYSFTNYYTPTTIYQLNTRTGQSTIYFAPEIAFNPENYISKQVFYKSLDGTRIPMMITHHRNIELNGSNPTMLYGYGGFNISMTPSFKAYNALWLAMGGVYAVPNLRGGGEYGKHWHLAGTKMQKQNVFDDFIAAAEFLIEKQYTTSDYLAVRGISNGGLLVGAVMTQKPELMRVALPAVGVLDMLRYHQFTQGSGWAYDYGTVDESKAMFEYLRAYSPVHNVEQGKSYPATLLTTMDNDSQVLPAHSYKFTAELQTKQSSEQPILIHIGSSAIHEEAQSSQNTIRHHADILSFTLFNMGIKRLRSPTN